MDNGKPPFCMHQLDYSKKFTAFRVINILNISFFLNFFVLSNYLGGKAWQRPIPRLHDGRGLATPACPPLPLIACTGHASTSRAGAEEGRPSFSPRITAAFDAIIERIR